MRDAEGWTSKGPSAARTDGNWVGCAGDAQEDTLVTKILKAKRNYVLVDAYNIEMSTQHIGCLNPLVWLNDEVINMYFELLGTRAQLSVVSCVFYSTFFYCNLFKKQQLRAMI